MIGRVAMAVGLALVLAAPVAVAQEGSPQPAAGAEQQPAQQEIDVSQIDRILRGEEEVLRGEIFSYDPAGRRDPFRSLLEGIKEEEASRERPPGLPGMRIEELTLEGIIETPQGRIAFAQGRDKVAYILREGTKLYNGEVKEILPDRVIFRQQVNDPKALKPYTEVVREIGQK